MVNLTMPETIMPKEDFTAILAERDRLKALNAELVAALKTALPYIEWAGDGAVRFPEDDRAEKQARAALAKARKED